MANNVFIYLAEPHCVLCRAALPFYPGINVFKANASAWEKDIVGIFDLSPTFNNSVIVSMTATLTENFPVIGTNVSVTYHGGQEVIMVARDRPNIKHRPFVFVHQVCAKVVESLPGRPDHRDIYNVAMQTQEILPRDCWGDEPPTNLASFPSTVMSGVVDTEKTELGSCLARCAQLPPELQYRIIGYVQGSKNAVAFSLMTALQTLTARRLLLMPAPPSQLTPGGPPGFDYVDTAHVCASLIDVLGRPYVWGIEFLPTQSHRPTSGKECLEVRLNSVRHMEFILGMFGITAIRFLMKDDSVTSWLGDARKGWRGKIAGFSRQHIQFPRSGHRDLVRRFAELLVQTARQDTTLHVLWDTSSRLLEGGESFLAHYYTDPPCSRPSAFLGIPMCRYLPLRLDGQYMRAITMYVFDIGVSCIVVHGQSSYRWVSVPLRKGVARTFYFIPGEEITTMGLVSVGDRIHPGGPFPLFKTNLNRIGYFGPAAALVDSSARWVSLIPDHLEKKCTVTGLVVDQMSIFFGFFKTMGSHCVLNEGVVAGHESPTSSSGLHLTLPDRPKVLRRLGFTPFSVVSTVRLYDIKQVRVLLKDARDVGNHRSFRHCGLWFLHGDGSIETLGSWDESLSKHAKVIYNETDGRLTRVIFRLKEGRHPCAWAEAVRYMSDISLRVVPHESEEEDPEEEPWMFTEGGDYVIHCKISPSKKIAWTYTDACDDIQDAATDTASCSVSRHTECNLVRVDG